MKWIIASNKRIDEQAQLIHFLKYNDYTYPYGQSQWQKH